MLHTTLLASLGLTCATVVAVLPHEKHGETDAAGSASVTTKSSPEDKNPYPHREKYSECTPISTEELAALGDEVFLIDARNTAEFAVIHIAGAQNLIVGKMEMEDLLALRGKDDPQPIVFYCNGHT